MRVIDQQTWPRREHFRLYSGFEFPHVSICVQLDITRLWINRARAGAAPTISLIYIITKAANRVPELRQRIRGKQVVEHEVIHPSVTVLGDDDVFGIVTLSYDAHFDAFAATAADCMAKARECISMSEFPHDQEGKHVRDDLLSITILPWLSFTGFAIARKPSLDCIPLVAFGKVQAVADGYRLPFFVNFHHALADGLHVARYIKYIEEEAQALADSF
ncbi:MAG: CatA-like O-acetyltransferase [Anaerolineae bacterium]